METKTEGEQERPSEVNGSKEKQLDKPDNNNSIRSNDKKVVTTKKDKIIIKDKINDDDEIVTQHQQQDNDIAKDKEDQWSEKKDDISNDEEVTEDNLNEEDVSESPEKKEAIDEDDGDPIPSGTGVVSKDCSELELIGWSEILPKWHAKLYQKPKGLTKLVRNGIPEPLRGEVWQLLSGAHESLELMEKYRIFLTKSAPTEQIILRDVHRTYPAHENFRSDGSSSLTDSLFKVCKAYAVYDEEVGYCQGLSFLVAALLLHMPEEQAFCVFARIMRVYGLRDLFRNNFDELYLKFYQLEHLLEEHMPDLHQHFTQIGIEPFTYASQWFLTVFTAKFPLNAVFYIMDIFLLDGMDTIFQVALALLKSSKQELLALDFEGVLRYFRVQMPKRYRNHSNVKQLIESSAQINVRKLKKYAKNYETKQKEKLLSQNPMTYIQLRAQLEFLEEKIDTLSRECQNHLTTISDMEDEKARLEVEVSQLKEVFRRELNRAESELARDNSIVSDYKKICSQLSRRLDLQTSKVDEFVGQIRDLLHDNVSCNEKSCYNIFQLKAEEFYKEKSMLDDEKSSSAVGGDSPPANAVENKQLERKVSVEQRSTIGAYIKSNDAPNETSPHPTSGEVKIKRLTKHIDDLEVELARTKLALVESECRNQQLVHDLSVGATVDMATSSSSSSSGLSSKLDFVKAAVNARRPASLAFAKINNLINEKISSPSTVDKC